ncbi:transcription antiterminator [Klebsiella quasipneumoniae]|nr:transcription antiterminator [Klebsiella quasipneumoniae]
MRFPNQRLAQLFTLLRNETLPQDELAQRLSVSTRTVRADITALNALLAQYGAQFILNRGSGYQLKIDNPASFQTLEETSPKAQHVPRTAQDRITFLLVRFLTSAFSIKLEDLADEWFVSRATLQNDMVEVRERFQRYQLTLETRPRHGMKLFGSEVSVRACLTDLLWELAQQGGIAPPIGAEAFAAEVQRCWSPCCRRRSPGTIFASPTSASALSACTGRWWCAASAKATRWRISVLKMWRRTSVMPRAIWRANCSGWPVNLYRPRKKSGCACISPPVRYRTWTRKPSAPTMTKRWSTTSCATSTASITTICWTMPSCTPIC